MHPAATSSIFITIYEVGTVDIPILWIRKLRLSVELLYWLPYPMPIWTHTRAHVELAVALRGRQGIAGLPFMEWGKCAPERIGHSPGTPYKDQSQDSTWRKSDSPDQASPCISLCVGLHPASAIIPMLPSSSTWGYWVLSSLVLPG